MSAMLRPASDSSSSEKSTAPFTSRTTDPGRRELLGRPKLVVGRQHRPGSIHDPHPASLERSHLRQPRFDAIKRRRHIQTNYRDITGPKQAISIGRAQ